MDNGKQSNAYGMFRHYCHSRVLYKTSMTSDTKRWTHGLFCLTPIVIATVCGIALVAVGMSMTIYFKFTSHFVENPSVCRVRDVLHLKADIPCFCGDYEEFGKCQSKYPCVQVRVDYTDSVTGESVKDALLYDLPRHYEVLHVDKCSTIACDEDWESNNRTVEEFVWTHGVLNQTFPCYHGQSSKPEAILTIIERWKIFLGMLLPALLLILSVKVLLCYCAVYPRCKIRNSSAKVDANIAS